LNSENYESPEQLLLSDPLRRKALELFEHEQKITEEEYNFGELFARILWERDWTDKLASIIGKIRNRFRLRNTDKALIPDMNEVAKAYDEMTSGYKEFIRTVLRAKHRWQEDE